MNVHILVFYLFSTSFFVAQNDTTKYQWPTPPFNSNKGLTATFGEFRNTGSADHFHNAVDIGEPDGNPVYPSIDGIVYSLSNNGYDSYINVKSTIDGQKKHLTYYHVVPSPTLSIGQQVIAGETIIGTIYVGAAHVHLIEREMLPASTSGIGNEINPVREEGGLFPYTDNYPPTIVGSSLKFFKDQSSVQVPSDQLSGKIDIRIEVREKNGPAFSQSNNGTYILGYRVLSEDGSTIIYEPENDGIKYRFYFIPYDSYVHQAFVKGVATLSDPIYWLTNGNGEAQINSTLSIPNNYLDTDLLDEGDYLLEIFSEDTRNNSVSNRFPIKVIKLPPALKTVIVKNDSIKISWEPYKINNLSGYRIYYSDDRTLDNWKLAADENLITANENGIAFQGPEDFLIPSESNELYFYITAVNDEGLESEPSDIYSLSIQAEGLPKTLIVDGFDRYGGSGSWSEPQHYFNKFYFDAILNNVTHNISSCSNEAVIDEDIDLLEYENVVWFLGDESIVDNTLNNLEQRSLAFFLEAGGNLFISGEDIGKDLDTKHGYNDFSDTLFYHQYLKAKLEHDGLDILVEVNGAEGTIFSDLNVKFGATYPVDAPDDIEPINGAHTIFNYPGFVRDSTFRKGGIAYQGYFREGSEVGSMVYLSFPFETIEDEAVRNDLYGRIHQYFYEGPVNVEQNEHLSNYSFELHQNYPNPFNPSTTIKYSIPSNLMSSAGSALSGSSKNRKDGNANGVSVKLSIYDILGREISVLVNRKQLPGNYQYVFDATDYPSGVYFYRLEIFSDSGSADFINVKKMMILK